MTDPFQALNVMKSAMAMLSREPTYPNLEKFEAASSVAWITIMDRAGMSGDLSVQVATERFIGITEEAQLITANVPAPTRQEMKRRYDAFNANIELRRDYAQMLLAEGSEAVWNRIMKEQRNRGLE